MDDYARRSTSIDKAIERAIDRGLDEMDRRMVEYLRKHLEEVEPGAWPPTRPPLVWPGWHEDDVGGSDAPA